MTKAEIENLSPEARTRYFEYEYPYVLPENEIIDAVDHAMTRSLSPLENAYVRWMMETYNRDMAVDSFIHPAVWFDKENYGSRYLKAKAEINQLLKEIRSNCPYLKLYSADYITGLIHDEIQYLRSPNRKERFYGASVDPAKFIGKKSPHDQEMEEIDRLLKCLDIIHNLKIAVGGYGSAPGDKQGNADSGFDRIVADAKALINRRENGSS